jgi:hypothetical protein
MKMTDPNDKMLDDLFAQARSIAPEPDDALMARVLADAATMKTPLPVVASQPGLWSRVMDAIGGWPAVSGLAAATVAGIWIGVAPPASVQDMTSTLIGDEVSVSFFSADFGLDEGTFVDG